MSEFIGETCVYCGQELTKDDEERHIKIKEWNNPGFNSCNSCLLEYLGIELRGYHRKIETLKEQLEWLEKIGKRKTAADLN